MTKEEISALATDAFEKRERARMLGLCNQPTDYEERKKAAVEYALACAEANQAERALQDAIKG